MAVADALDDQPAKGCGACGDHSVHPDRCRVVPMRDAARLADALTEILANRELQASMGSYNRHRVEQEFDWSRSLDRMESVYSQVLTPRREVASDALPETRWT